MTERLIVTNNPTIEEGESGHSVRRVEGVGLPAVFAAALDLAQRGWRLLSAPLPPNVPLIRAPYRSLLMEKNTRQYDAEGLKALEKARQRAELLTENRTDPGPAPARDAAFIDRQLLLRAISESRILEEGQSGGC